MYPVQNITGEENEAALTLYTIITFLLIFSVIIYILFYSLTDCRPGCVGSRWFKLCRNGDCDKGECDGGTCKRGM